VDFDAYRAAVTYLISFACYGCHWHGHASGSVDRRHNLPSSRLIEADKSYASRCLNRMGPDEPTRKRWAKHGSTRWLWKPTQVSAAIRYVAAEQGEPMAVFEAVESCP